MTKLTEYIAFAKNVKKIKNVKTSAIFGSFVKFTKIINTTKLEGENNEHIIIK